MPGPMRDKMIRFTPAYAGKMIQAAEDVRLPTVHPRIRGEDLLALLLSQIRTGSPPHTRGRSEAAEPETLPRRFTPAYAGKIGAIEVKGLREQVHPRIRGEDGGGAHQHRVLGGSPPHTRGRFAESLGTMFPEGFTPAYAGKILIRRRYERREGVHPRIRGEDQ